MASGGSVAKLKPLPSVIAQPDEVYLRSMDENEVLAGLADKTNPARRAAIIEELRASVRRNGGRLIFEDRHGLFHVFQGALCGNDPNARLRCIEFISEIVPEFGFDLDNCMSLVLPQLVSNLGNHTVTVKKSAIQTLHVYMKNSSNVGAVFNAIIEHGLESEDKRTRAESLVALPILITPNLAHEDLFVLTKALVGRLESSSRPEPTVLSLDRIRNVVGQDKFWDYVHRLPNHQQQLCFQAIQNWGSFYKGDLEIPEPQKAKSVGQLNANGVIEFEGNSDRGHTIALPKSYATTTRESFRVNDEGVEFGFVPRSTVAKLRDQSNWRIRAQGIEELKIAMGHLTDTSSVLPYLASLFGVLLDFLDDLNFKITVTSLQIIGLLVAKLNSSVGPFLKPLVSALANKLGDNKIVIRQENMKVLMQLMQILSPKAVLSVLTSSLQHPKSKVREETLNVVIGALLTFPRSDFDLPELTNAIAPALADSKRKVRQAALEAFAVIAQAMGPGHLQPVVSAVDTVELTRGGDGVMAAVQARLARRQLPRLNSDGLVEYAIPVPSSGTVRGQSSVPRGADIEWVLAGTGGSGLAEYPNSARSTPGLNDSMNSSGASPRRYFSAGKNRLPWEEVKDPTQPPDMSEQVPPPVRNSWVPGEIVNDRSGKRKPPQGVANLDATPSSTPSSTPKLGTSSYKDKYIARNLHHSHQSPESHLIKSPDTSSYAEMHRSKIKKDKSKGSFGAPVSIGASPTHPGASTTGGAGGSYALLYKRGTIHSKAKASTSAEPAIGDGSPKETVLRGTQSATPTGLPSHSGFVPADEEFFNTQRKSFSNSLSNSWPDWTDAYSTGRPWGRLSPVPHGATSDPDISIDLDGDGKRTDPKGPRTPVHVKPQLARSASKTRSLKTQDIVDGLLGIDQLEPSLNRTTPLAPVTSSMAGAAVSAAHPPKDSLKQVHKNAATKRALQMYSAASDSDDGGTRTPSPSEISNGVQPSPTEEFISPSESSSNENSPFNGKPRIARTPVHSKRLSAKPQLSDAEGLGVTGHRILSKDISGKNSVLGSEVNSDLSSVSGTSGIGSSVKSGEDLSDVTVVGKRLFRKGSNRADSLEGKYESKKKENGRLEYEPEESDEEEDDSVEDDSVEEEEGEEDQVEEEDEEEEETETETEKEEDVGDSSEEDDLLQKDDDILEGFGDNDDSSDSDVTDSDTERKNEETEGMLERDMTPRAMRKSLSKSTRERMERKRKMEEERLLSEQLRIEELEREKAKQLQLQKEEENRLRKKIMKEQSELEKMLQKKEKERQLERHKQKQLQEQLQQQEKTLREKLLKQQEELEEIEKEKQREREREKERARERMKQKQLKLQREKEEAERQEQERRKEEATARLKQQQRKEDELKRKLALEEVERRKRQQQAARELKEAVEDTDLSVTGSSTPIKQPSGKSPRKKAQMSSAQSERDASYAVTHDASDTRRHHIASASSGASAAAIWETSLDELQPFGNPDTALRDGLKYMGNTEDWEMKCEGLQCVRRLTKNHPETVIAQLHTVILAVVAEVKNLRTQVSRAAICCLGDMYTCLGRQLDTDLEVTSKILLIKSGETSGFIREDVDKSLLAMVYNVTATRALLALTSTGCGHRSVAVRKTSAQFLSILAERIGANRLMSGAKDVTDRILPAAAQFSTDGGSETRYYGRKILYTLYDHPEFDKLLTKHVAANFHRQVRDIVESLKTKGLGDPPNDLSSARQRKNMTGSGSHSRSGSGTSGKGSVRASTDPSLHSSVMGSPAVSRESSRSGKLAAQEAPIQGEELLPDLISYLSANDWKDRLQGLDLFVNLAERNPNRMGSKFTKAFDVLIPRLQDSNSKVNLYALQCLPKIIPSLAGQSGALVPPIVAALTANLASKNTSIFSAADEALTALTKHIDKATLVQPFCTTSQYGNSRVKPVMIDKLCLIVEGVYSRKPQVIQRYVLPLLWNLLGSANTGSAGSGTNNVKTATVKLTSTVYSCMGKALLDHASTQLPRIQERLKEITVPES